MDRKRQEQHEGDTSLDTLLTTLEASGKLRLVQIQVAQLRDVLALPEGHGGRAEQVLRYQSLLEGNGIEAPPTTIHEAIELINQVGEFNG